MKTSKSRYHILHTISIILFVALAVVFYIVAKDSEIQLVAASFVMLISLVVYVFSVSYIRQRIETTEDMISQLGAIADIYISLHKCDLRNEKITEIRAVKSVADDVNSEEGTIQQVLNRVMFKRTAQQSLEEMLAFIDLSTLDERLKDRNTITLEFLGLMGWARARIIAVERENGKITVFLWMIESIDKEKRRQNELVHLSEIDQMTEILNRGSGEKKTAELLAEEKYGMLCIFDIDRFKDFNDNYGHGVGDQVIKEVAKCLVRSFRETDLVMRFGGDEFAVYAQGITDVDRGKRLAERFFGEVNMIDIPAINGKRNISVSMGASFFKEDHKVDFETLYKEADECTYKSKQIDGSYASFHV